MAVKPSRDPCDLGVIAAIAEDISFLIALRRDIHAHPELSFEEQRTSDVIARALTEWGIPVHRGLAGTGVVGVIQSGSADRAIGLRADMDALPIAEQNTFAHASTHANTMHACGHDGHIAMLLAAAKQLARHRHFDGTVYLIFQPAEEKGGGAREMIKAGLFERFPMQAIFGAHNWPGMSVGQFALRAGPTHASASTFSITIRGAGAHAAMPNEGIDPIPIGCQIVQGLQTIITRNKPPLDVGVISVTMIRAGEVTNAVPASCEIRGTVRTMATEVLDMIEQRMREISDLTSRAFGASCEVVFERNYPVSVNSLPETDFVREVLSALVGRENVVEFAGTMGSEDFGFYLQEKPGCYFMIGNGEGQHRAPGHASGPCNLHNPSYDFNDDLIAIGGSMWVRMVEAWFRSDVSDDRSLHRSAISQAVNLAP